MTDLGWNVYPVTDVLCECSVCMTVLVWRQYTVQAFALQVCYSAHIGNYWLTFIVLLLGCWKGDQQRLRKNPEERRPHLHRDGSLKSWFSLLSVSPIAAEKTSWHFQCDILCDDRIIITDSDWFSSIWLLSSTVDNADGALVNKQWRIAWKSVGLNVMRRKEMADRLSVFMNRICTNIWMLSFIEKVI
jgi:hypothetical protein